VPTQQHDRNKRCNLKNIPSFVIVIGRKYQKDFAIGSLVSLMLPFSICFLISWTLLFLAWGLLGLPLGPHADIFFTLPGT